MCSCPGSEGNSTATLTASVRTVTQDNSTGTWNWSLSADDEKNLTTVIITATDNSGNTSGVPFDFEVLGFDPGAILQTNSGVTYGNSATAALVDAFDPSPADTAAGFHYAFSFDPGSVLSATYATSGTANSFDFGILNAGTYTIYAKIITPK